MHRTIIAALVLAPALALALAAGPSLAQSITLKGASGQTATITAAEIAALPRTSFTLDAHGTKHVFAGPLLIDVLAKVGAQKGTALRGPGLAQAVVVTASDGYRVVYGLAEADPGTRPNRIILADRADGKPMDAKDGPFRLVVEGDLRPARAVRMVGDIEVVNLSRPADAKASPHPQAPTQ